jgi:hypothetical protein
MKVSRLDEMIKNYDYVIRDIPSRVNVLSRDNLNREPFPCEQRLKFSIVSTRARR